MNRRYRPRLERLESRDVQSHLAPSRCAAASVSVTLERPLIEVVAFADDRAWAAHAECFPEKTLDAPAVLTEKDQHALPRAERQTTERGLPTAVSGVGGHFEYFVMGVNSLHTESFAAPAQEKPTTPAQRAKEEEVWSFVEKFVNYRINRELLCYGRRVSDPTDVFQDTVVEALQTIGRSNVVKILDASGPERKDLGTIVSKLISRASRADRKYLQGPEVIDIEPLRTEGMIDSRPSWAEIQSTFQNHLSETQWRILNLKTEGLTYESIGEQLGMSRRMANQLGKQGIEKLRCMYGVTAE